MMMDKAEMYKVIRCKLEEESGGSQGVMWAGTE